MKFRPDNPDFPRAIFHMDGDAFFVGVEVAKDPKLKGLPVVTGSDRGIVTAASYEAKALGIPRAIPIFQVKKNFPQVIILPGDYASYVQYSDMMFDIVRRYADDVEEYSIDECFADLTGLDWPLGMTYEEIARRIQKEVSEELGLSISVGLAPSKVLAKVASKWRKPNGLTVITLPSVRTFLAELPIYKIWGIGPKTSQSLFKKGIATALDFIDKDETWVQHTLSKPYYAIWQELRGVSVFAVDGETKTTYASIQRTRTFHPPTTDKKFLFSQLSKHIEDSCMKARRYSLAPKNISIFLKTQTFRYAREDVKLAMPTNAPEVLLPLVSRLLDSIYKERTPYRATGVTLHELAGTRLVQQDLFGDRVKVGKFETIHEQMDALEAKFGKHVVHLASSHSALHRKKLGSEAEDLDRDLLFL